MERLEKKYGISLLKIADDVLAPEDSQSWGSYMSPYSWYEWVVG